MAEELDGELVLLHGRLGEHPGEEGRGRRTHDGLDDEMLVVAGLPRSAAGFEAFVVPESNTQVIPPKT